MLFGLGMNPIIEIDLPNGWKAEISSKTASTGTITFSYAQAVFLTQDIIVRVVGDDDVTTEDMIEVLEGFLNKIKEKRNNKINEKKE